MKKILVGTLLCLSFSATAWAKDNVKIENLVSKEIKENTEGDRLLYQCRITVTTTHSDGTTSTTIYTYTLDGTRDACEDWCNDKADQFK